VSSEVAAIGNEASRYLANLSQSKYFVYHSNNNRGVPAWIAHVTLSMNVTLSAPMATAVISKESAGRPVVRTIASNAVGQIML
jgi:hypothetical protein